MQIENSNVQVTSESMPIGNIMLSAGDFIKTKWGWWAEIKEVNKIKDGQGLLVRRLNDNTIHSISDEDVIDFNHA